MSLLDPECRNEIRNVASRDLRHLQSIERLCVRQDVALGLSVCSRPCGRFLGDEILFSDCVERVAGALPGFGLVPGWILTELHLGVAQGDLLADTELNHSIFVLDGLEALHGGRAERNAPLLVAEGVLEDPIPGAASA